MDCSRPPERAPAPLDHSVSLRQVVFQKLSYPTSRQDEPEDMVEWMAHHQRLGVGRFYIFDNGSNPPLNGSFVEQILSGLVKCARSRP